MKKAKVKKAKSDADKNIHFSKMPVFAVTIALLLSLVVVTNSSTFLPGITGATVYDIQAPPERNDLSATCYPEGQPCFFDTGKCKGDFSTDSTEPGFSGDTDINCDKRSDVMMTKDKGVGNNICKKGVTWDRNGENAPWGALTKTDYCVNYKTVHEYSLECWEILKHQFLAFEVDWDCFKYLDINAFCSDGACRRPSDYGRKIIYVDDTTLKLDAVSDGTNWYYCDAFDRVARRTTAHGTSNIQRGEGDIDNIGGHDYICYKKYGVPSIGDVSRIAECCGNDDCFNEGGLTAGNLLGTTYKCMSTARWCGPVAATEDCSTDKDDNCDGYVNEGCAITCNDKDKDGFSPDGGACGAVDCNDNVTNDPYTCPLSKDSCTAATSKCAICIYPGATEHCTDGVDNDCNGLVDAKDTACMVKKCTNFTGFQEYNPVLQNCDKPNATLSTATVGCCEGTITNRTCDDIGGGKYRECNTCPAGKIINALTNTETKICCNVTSCPSPECKDIGVDLCYLTAGEACAAADQIIPTIEYIAGNTVCCNNVCTPSTPVTKNCFEYDGYTSVKFINITTTRCLDFNWIKTIDETNDLKCCNGTSQEKSAQEILKKCEEYYPAATLCDLTKGYKCPSGNQISASDASPGAVVCCQPYVSCTSPAIGILETPYTPTAGECAGCTPTGTTICVPVTARYSGQYCGFDKILHPQKAQDALCENSYECAGNVCADGKCTGVREALGLIYKIWYWLRCWITNPTDTDMRDLCISCATQAANLDKANECFG